MAAIQEINEQPVTNTSNKPPQFFASNQKLKGGGQHLLTSLRADEYRRSR
jgi:hypothetical protein